MSLDDLLTRACPGSDSELARKLKVTRQAVSSWRRGETYPNWAHCARMASVSGMTLATVLETVSAARSGRRKR